MKSEKLKVESLNRRCGHLAATLLITLHFSLFTFHSASADDRFPPYDNTAEVEAFWKSKPDFFQWKTLADLPQDLSWQNGDALPEMGDPAAKKGGTFRDFVDTFPATFRTIGPDANGSFRSEHHDNILVTLLQRHLNVDGWIGGLAESWAISADRKTIYYRLRPGVTYSDGVPITVEDFFMTFYIMLSPHIQDPWYNDFYAKEFKSIIKYDERTLSITLPDVKPDPLWYADLPPSPRGFYKEFTDDFPARYQWRKCPTTGAYEILPEDIKKGRSITLTRVKNWWGRDVKGFRYRFNPDFIEYKIIASPDKAFEIFRQGQLDFFAMGLPQYWYDKSEIPQFYKGYIEKGVFYNDYPRITRGIYLNQSKPPLDNLDVRIGMAHSLNFKKVIEIDFRGDYSRMKSTFAGFGRYTNPTIKPREFDLLLAQQHFAKAGYSKRGSDGVLVNASGQRLSVTLSLPSSGPTVQIALRLKEEALKAGLDLNVEALDSTQLFKKLDQKNHQACLVGWGASPPYPRFWEYYHTDNAWKIMPDGTRKIVPDTNNVTMTADPAMDAIIDLQRKAEDDETMQRLCWQLEEMVEAKAVSIPAWESPSYRYGHWRWVRWPGDGNLKVSQLPLDTYVHWLDEDIRQETKQAMKEDRSFGEVTRIFDQYRQQ
jgi:microcin C transport system substrate-binding protein